MLDEKTIDDMLARRDAQRCVEYEEEVRALGLDISLVMRTPGGWMTVVLPSGYSVIIGGANRNKTTPTRFVLDFLWVAGTHHNVPLFSTTGIDVRKVWGEDIHIYIQGDTLGVEYLNRRNGSPPMYYELDTKRMLAYLKESRGAQANQIVVINGLI